MSNDIEQDQNLSITNESFADFIVYVDESGDPTLEKIKPEYPVFVLSFCVFRKAVYAKDITPDMTMLKFKYFGHDMIVFHEREIRKREGCFSSLNKENAKDFFDSLTEIIASKGLALIAVVIKKDLFKQKYNLSKEPYKTAMQYGLETLYDFLKSKGCSDHGKTFVVCESRGRKEDSDLKTSFLSTCLGDNKHQKEYPFEVVFASKSVNSCGLQLADLTARPIGQFVMRPEQENRTYKILKDKLLGNEEDFFLVKGLRIVP